MATTLIGAAARSSIAARGRPDPVRLADELATAFLRLGSAYLKLGQVLASSPGVIGEDVADAFRKCLDVGESIPVRTLHTALERAAGRPVDEAYREVDENAVGRASIAVVHRAVTFEGAEVAVKVRRPDIADLVTVDLALLRGAQALISVVSRASDGDLGELLDDFERTVTGELDLARERRAMDRARSQLADAGLDRVLVPATHAELSDEDVLVMDYLVGCPLDDVKGIRERGLDAGPLVDEVIRTWLITSLGSDEFHGDCHAGNLLVLDDGRVALLDWGIVGRLTARGQQLCTDLLLGSLGSDDAWKDVAAGFASQYGDRLTTGFGITSEELPEALRDLLGPLLTAPFGHRSLADFMDQVKLADTDAPSGDATIVEGAEPDFEHGFFLWIKQLVFFERYARIHRRSRAVANYAADMFAGRSGPGATLSRGGRVTALHHAGLVTRDLDTTATELERLGFTVTTPKVPVLPTADGTARPFGAANLHADFPDGTFLEALTVVDRGQPGPTGAIPVQLRVPERAVPHLRELIEGVLARLRSQLERFEGIHVLVFEAPEIYTEGRRLSEAGIAHSGVTSAGRRERGVDAPSIRVVEIDDPRVPTPEGRLALASPSPAATTRHANGALGLEEVILYTSTQDIGAIARRYEQLLDVSATETSRGTELVLERSTVLLVDAAGLDRALPGEEPAALPSFAAVTIKVDDLAHTVDHLRRNGHTPRPAQHGEVFIPAMDGPGPAFVFRQR